jgi:pimeloyl-ACP methyl ester carboxylesterase
MILHQFGQAAQCIRSRLSVLDQAGHLPHLEKAGEADPLIEALIDAGS